MKSLIAALALAAAALPAAAHDTGRGHAHSAIRGGYAYDPFSPSSGPFYHEPVRYPAVTRLFVVPGGRAFRAIVSPDLVTHREAVAQAGRTAGAYCRATFGTNRVVIEGINLHSRVELDSWEVRGRCG